MVGFIKGLFGSNGQGGEGSSQPPAAPQNTEAFFLDMDDARTMGDINYMRKAKAVRRTFPKTASQPEEQELNIEVSATVMKEANLNGQVASNSLNGSQPTTPKVDEAIERRRTDTSMDMFRNMAKSIKKP